MVGCDGGSGLGLRGRGQGPATAVVQVHLIRGLWVQPGVFRGSCCWCLVCGMESRWLRCFGCHWQTEEEAAKIYTVSAPGSQLFAAINVCMRNSCDHASPCCVPLCRGAEMGRCVLKWGGA